MSSFPVTRARSAVTLPRGRSVERGNVATLTRVATVPNLHDYHVGDRYHQSTLYKYRQDYDLLDDYVHDKLFYHTPLYLQDYRFTARRYLNTDAMPSSPGFVYPISWSRYKWYTDWLNPTYWRRYRDANYDRPLWNAWKPWMFDRDNIKRGVKMYREGLINFETLDKNWIVPSALDRKGKDWADIYLPAGRYGARRYFYSFG